MPEQITETPDSHRDATRRHTISVSGGRVGRRLLAILLIVLGISILIFPLLHSGH